MKKLQAMYAWFCESLLWVDLTDPLKVLKLEYTRLITDKKDGVQRNQSKYLMRLLSNGKSALQREVLLKLSLSLYFIRIMSSYSKDYLHSECLIRMIT